MTIFTEYYPVVIECLVFVCLLGIFEYILYYYVLVPADRPAIQNEVNRDVNDEFTTLRQKLTGNSDDSKNYVMQYLEKNPKIASFVSTYMRTLDGSLSIDLSQTGYRNYLEQLDIGWQEENIVRKDFITILLIFLTMVIVILILYGRYILLVRFNIFSIFASLFFTFVFILIFQLYFVFKVVPKFQMVNKYSIQRVIDEFLLNQKSNVFQ